MIYKYLVPEHYKKMYNNKEVIYCKVIKKIDGIEPKIYLVKMINLMGVYNIFNRKSLKKLSLLDIIKVIFLKRRDTNEKV